jgi:hypothetical protein
MKLTLNAADVETAFAVNVTATHARTPKNLSAVNSVNAITSRVTVTTAFCARDLIEVSASVERANVMKDGVEMLVSAAVQLRLAKHLTVKFARDMDFANVVDANVKLKTTSDTQESTAKNARHARDDATNLRAVSNAKCTRREN